MSLLMCVFSLLLCGCVHININQYTQIEQPMQMSSEEEESKESETPPILVPPLNQEKPLEKPSLDGEVSKKLRFEELVPYIRSHPLFQIGEVEELTPISLLQQVGIKGEEIIDSFVIKSIQSDYVEIAIFQCKPFSVSDVQMKVVAHHQKNVEAYPMSENLANAKWVLYDEDTVIYVATGNNEEWLNKIQSFG